MNSDLPAETGSLDPGLGELFRALTAGPTGSERAGEQAALGMFRENVRPAAAPAGGRGRFGSTAGRSRRGTGRSRGGAPARWGIRLVAAATLVLSGGLAAAAYAAALPAPVQHLAYDVLGGIGVPDTQNNGHANSSPQSPGRTGPPGGHHHSKTPGTQSPAPPGGTKSAQPVAHTSAPASPSPSTSAAAGPDRLSAATAAGQVTAGSSVVISGTLTTSAGPGVPGTTVTLLKRPGRQTTWRAVGIAKTDSAGNVAFTIPLLGANAAFELAGPGVVVSSPVAITVIPPVDTVLIPGATGVRDVLVVSTQYAHAGNIVVLQKQTAGGVWVSLRRQTLTAAGKTRFLLNGRHLQNEMVRVVLLAGPRHGESISAPVTVPPPVA